MRKLLIAILSAVAIFSAALCISCGGGNDQNGPIIAFNEGYLDVITLGDPVMLDEYVDPMILNDYDLTLTSNETGEVIDLTAYGQWTTTYTGEFTLTYTVDMGNGNKQTIKTTISVVAPEIDWKFNRAIMYARVGETLQFSTLRRNLGIYVESYYDYVFVVKAVRFNGKKVDIKEGATSFAFTEEGEHVFTFGVITEDGQERYADQKITVRPLQEMEDGAEVWLEDNNIEVHDYKYVSKDGAVTLDAGYYNNEFIYSNIPYVAFKGDYGADTYFTFEFTGKNLPQLAFFCDEITQSIFDGKKGIYIHNGLTYNDGRTFSAHDESRLTIFGPNKVSYGTVDNKGRFEGSIVGNPDNPSPISYRGLKDGNKYRYIVGFSDASNTSVTLNIILVNLTTCERELTYKKTLSALTSNGGNVDFTDYFTGSVVAYGRFGVETKIDKIYAPRTDVDDILDLDIASEFKSGVKTQYRRGASVSVTDFIDDEDGVYEFTVTSPSGETVEITNGFFTLAESGTYRVVYDSLEDSERLNSITLQVMFDPSEDLGEDFFEEKGLIYATAVRAGTGLAINTDKEFINEGNKSVRYYTTQTTTGGLGIVVGLQRSYLEYLFLAREIDGITFQVYSPIDVNYKLYPAWGDFDGRAIKYDLTGFIPAETWTTITVTRDICYLNNGSYAGWECMLAISFYGDREFNAQECLYIDSIGITTQDINPTLSDGAKAFIEANDIEVYGYNSINDDLTVELQKGFFQGYAYNGNMKNDDVPYIAYNGDYGVGSYVVADFTGVNVPQVCLFVKNNSSSLLDGGDGVYIHTGLVNTDGSNYGHADSGRVTFFGPRKIEYCEIDNRGRFSGTYGTTSTTDMVNVSPLSIRGLVDGVHYRYVVGIKSVTTGKVVLELLLINLDTKTEVVRYERTLDSSELTADFCTGNILLYGRYNVAITLDKIYSIYSNVTSAYDIDLVKSGLGN